jgi:hypothetical protein
VEGGYFNRFVSGVAHGGFRVQQLCQTGREEKRGRQRFGETHEEISNSK